MASHFKSFVPGVGSVLMPITNHQVNRFFLMAQFLDHTMQDHSPLKTST